jgi:hypothetical protein
MAFSQREKERVGPCQLISPSLSLWERADKKIINMKKESG